MTGIQDDLATLRSRVSFAHYSPYTSKDAGLALARVEAEIARLEQDLRLTAAYREAAEAEKNAALIEISRLGAQIATQGAEVARLREGHLEPWEIEKLRSEFKAAEAEAERLRDVLGGFLHDADNNDRPGEGLRDMARALLADDGAAQPKMYAANDWESILRVCVACPGCGFTFDAEHVTDATGQYDCPVCHAQSRDGAA